MLEKVFNMFVDIPTSLAINIPGLRDASSLPHLKKVRQKIKNKLKVAKAQLKYQQNSKKVENSSISNDIFLISGKKTNNKSKVLKNNDNKSCTIFPKKYSTDATDNNSIKLSNKITTSYLEPNYDGCSINETPNAEKDTHKTHVQSASGNVLSPTTQFKPKDLNLYINQPINSNHKTTNIDTNLKIEFTKTNFEFSWELLAVSIFYSFLL